MFRVFGAKDDDINALDELNDTQSDNKTATMLYSTFIPDEVDDLDNCTIRNEDEDNDFQDISHFNIAEVFEETEDEVYMLPKHHRCAAHTLNLIATNVRELYFLIFLNFRFILYIIISNYRIFEKLFLVQKMQYPLCGNISSKAEQPLQN